MAKQLYTKDEINDAIDKEISWRKKELQIYKTNVCNAKGDNQKVLLRASIPFIYSHWEGFVKKSCEAYLEYVSNKNLNLNTLKPQFIAIALKSKIEKSNENSVKKRTEYVKILLENIDKPSNLNLNGVIKTKSNLRFDVFEEICYTLCIDINRFEHKKAEIDELVDNRNTIAHGNYQKITFAIFEGFFDDVISLLENLRTELQNSVARESYKL